MARYEVPQFSEIQTKIVGPFTLKQFLYLGFGGGIFYLFIKTLNFFLALLFGVPIAALALALAFVKINGQPFSKFLADAFKFISRPKFYIWKKELPKIKQITYKEDD